MNLLALVNIQDPTRTVIGGSVLDLVSQLPGVSIDLVKRRAIFNNEPDSVSFSDEYAREELPQAIAERVLQVYVRDLNWVLCRGKAKANAHLIAAAPELLGALKDVVGDLKLFVSRQGPGPNKRLAACLAAIAKAEGRSE